MANGAAGCGYEHRNTPGMCCPHLGTRPEGFTCLKYFTGLKTEKMSGDPFRCAQCVDDADRHIASVLARKRAEENARVRGVY